MVQRRSSQVHFYVDRRTGQLTLRVTAQPQPHACFSLFGYFFSMIAALTAVAGVMIGLSNASISERVRHYLRPVVERKVTAANTKPSSFVVLPTEKADAKKSKKVLARQHDNYELLGAEEPQSRPQRLLPAPASQKVVALPGR
jgi:hypothetical protein